MLSQFAIASEAGTRLNLDGLRPWVSGLCASAAARLNMSVRPRAAIASKSECLVRGADVGFDVAAGGIVPRRLLVELVTDCLVCIGLLDVEVSFSFCFLRRVFFEPVLSAKAAIPAGTRHD
jgi:hypothetical protein